ASSRELTLLGTVFAIFVILCGTAIFICEQFVESPVNEFRTIPIGFWWALVTMTTLGYGDMVPRTLPGYIVGGVCAISGVLVIALPVPIIARLKLPKRKKRVLVGAHDALKQTAGAVIVGCGDGDGDGGCISGGGGNGCGSEHQLSCSDSGEETPS
uniref:Ion_trans domain-containing protein n=1 Tax=Macrostomum lignano TaxID=282301 RepID=A0A1I8F3L4_9PLAT